MNLFEQMKKRYDEDEWPQSLENLVMSWFYHGSYAYHDFDDHHRELTLDEVKSTRDALADYGRQKPFVLFLANTQFRFQILDNLGVTTVNDKLTVIRSYILGCKDDILIASDTFGDPVHGKFMIKNNRSRLVRLTETQKPYFDAMLWSVGNLDPYKPDQTEASA